MTISFGRLLAGLACLFGAPAHLVLCALIKVCGPGPALYRANRLGKDGTTFGLLKYRTMKVNASPVVEAGFKMVVGHADPRVTGVGRWLRCGIDELPQLWNIVRGEMKWVGPRPDEAWMMPHYGTASMQRLSVYPGITGLAQVLNSRNLSTAEGFAIDLWYIAHRSVWLDLWIVLVTPLFMSGWRTLGRGHLKRLRCSPEFERFRRCCDSELSAAMIALPASVDATAIAKTELS